MTTRTRAAMGRLTIATIPGNVAVFVGIGVLVTRHAASGMDAGGVRLAAAVRSPGMDTLMQALTALMSGIGLTVFAVLAAIVYWRSSARREAALRVLIAIVGGELVTNVLKEMYHRPRPATAVGEHLNFSYPSGHTFFGLVVYGLIAASVVEGAPGRVRWGVRVACAIVVLLTGFSRVYVGMHYLSDVLGGWASGMVWYCVCRAIPLQRKAMTPTGSLSRPGQ